MDGVDLPIVSDPVEHFRAENRQAETHRFQPVARIALGTALTALGIWTLQGFLHALLWAGVLAIAIWPLLQLARARFPASGHDILVPAAFTLVVGAVFVIPLGLIATQLGSEAHNAIAWAQEAQKTGIPVPAAIGRLPFSTSIGNWWRTNLADPEHLSLLLGRVSRVDLMAYSRELGAKIVHRVVLLGFTLVTLFFLFRDGEALVRQMRVASLHAFGPSGERVGRQIVASVHGTVDGLVFVGIGEGVLLGIAYAIAGVPHPSLFGAATGIAAMIPLATPVVFGIVALLLLAQGSFAAAVAIVVFGFLVLFVADHLVRPVLIGGACKLPFLWVLLGILGGVESFGLLGLFLGPAVMAALILLWREWTHEPVAEAAPAAPAAPALILR